MATRSPLIHFCVVFLLFVSAASALLPSDPKAISDLRETVVKGLGFQDVKISGFDVRDALVGQSMAYEFDIEIDKKVVPIKLLEDVNRWSFVDLPIFRAESENVDGNGVIERGRVEKDSSVLPVLPPFELAGPMEVWIQDGDDMRLSLPHDVDAGTLKKVLLADGATVTVKGARSVSLRHPLEFPLPFNRSTTHQPDNPIASGLLTLSEALRLAASHSTDDSNNQVPLLSLRIVGPTSLSSSDLASSKNKLKLKRLAPGLVELSSRTTPVPYHDERTLTSIWPLTSINASNPNLRGFEEILVSILGKKVDDEGSFRLTKAKVSAQTYVKMGFKVEKKIKEEEMDWSKYPEWRTRPEKVVAHFEVLGRVEDNGKVVPERIQEVQPFQAVESVVESMQTGNETMSNVEVLYPPPAYFVL